MLNISIRLAVAGMCWAGCAGGINFNQTDTFEGGTTEGWGGNMLGVVQPVASGGPDGVEDGFLQVSVPAFHLGTKNTGAWTGDFLAAGVEAIEMDLKRFDSGSDAMEIRILLFGPGGTFAWQNLTPTVPVGQWTHYVFGLTSNDLVHVTGGTTNLAETLTGVATLLIRNDRLIPTLPGTHPPHISGTLGIDNIHAVPRRPRVGGLQHIGGDIVFQISDLVPGVTNQVQSATGLSPGSWSNLVEVVGTGTSTNLTFTPDSAATFYRVDVP